MRSRNVRGFTLLEVLIAGGLFFIAVAGVFSSFSTASRLTRHFELETAALHVADGFLEELVLRPRDSSDLAAGPHPATALRFGDDGVVNPAGRYTLAWIVHDDVPVPGLRSVDVTVTWLEGSTPHSVRLSTVRE